MIIVRCTDEFVVRSVHQIPDTLDLSRCLIHEFLRCGEILKCFNLDLLTMFVSSCLETYVVSDVSLVSGNAVCKYNLIRIAYMRLTRCVCDCGCNVVRFFRHMKPLPYFCF